MYSNLLQAAVASFLPQPQAAELTEPAAVAALRSYRRERIAFGNGEAADTAFIPPASAGGASALPPVCLLHGFDSNSMEFRRLLPLLAEAGVAAWAVDSLGCGFTQV